MPTNISNFNNIMCRQLVLSGYPPYYADALQYTLNSVPVYEDGKWWFEDRTKNSYDMQIVNSNNVTLTGTETLDFDDLTGITISSYIGTSTPTINGNSVEFTAGTMEELVFDNGSKYTFAIGDGLLYEYDNNTTNALDGTWSADVRSTGDGKPHNLLNGFTQGLYCSASGVTSCESTQAIGTWEIGVDYKGTTAFYDFMASSDTPTGNGYVLVFVNNGELRLSKRTSGARTILDTTGTGYLVNGEAYKIRITREDGTGLTKAFIKGGSKGSTYTEILSFIDNTYTISAYQIADFDAGTSFFGLVNESNCIPFNFITKTGAYNKLYYPIDPTGTGEPLSNPAGRYHNNAESGIIALASYTDLETMDRTSGQNYFYDGAGNPKTLYFSDRNYEVYDTGTLYGHTYSNITAINQWKNLVSYETQTVPLSMESVRKLRFVDGNELLLDENGSPITDINGELVYDRKVSNS